MAAKKIKQAIDRVYSAKDFTHCQQAAGDFFNSLCDFLVESVKSDDASQLVQLIESLKGYIEAYYLKECLTKEGKQLNSLDVIEESINKIKNILLEYLKNNFYKMDIKSPLINEIFLVVNELLKELDKLFSQKMAMFDKDGLQTITQLPMVITNKKEINQKIEKNVKQLIHNHKILFAHNFELFACLLKSMSYEMAYFLRAALVFSWIKHDDNLAKYARKLALPVYLYNAFGLADEGQSKKNKIIDVINLLAGFARIAGRDGILALEDDLEKIKHPLLRTGTQLIVDGTDPRIVLQILNNKIEVLSGYYTLKTNIIIQGLLGVSAVNNPRILEEKLLATMGDFKNKQLNKLIKSIIRLCEIVRREGVLAIEYEETEDPVLKQGISMICAGLNPELIEQLLKQIALREYEQEELYNLLVTYGLIMLQSGAEAQHLKTNLENFVPFHQNILSDHKVIVSNGEDMAINKIFSGSNEADWGYITGIVNINSLFIRLKTLLESFICYNEIDIDLENIFNELTRQVEKTKQQAVNNLINNNIFIPEFDIKLLKQMMTIHGNEAFETNRQNKQAFDSLYKVFTEKAEQSIENMKLVEIEKSPTYKNINLLAKKEDIKVFIKELGKVMMEKHKAYNSLCKELIENGNKQIQKISQDTMGLSINLKGLGNDLQNELVILSELIFKDKDLVDNMFNILPLENAKIIIYYNFKFEYIFDIYDSAMKIITKHINIQDLVLALRGEKEELQNIIIEKMDKKNAQQLKEKLATNSPFKLADKEKAQLRIISKILWLEKQGQIYIFRRK